MIRDSEGRMRNLFWTGKLSAAVKLMVDSNNLLAWLSGNARDRVAMKHRVRRGYEGAFSDSVSHYDELGAEFQTKSAAAQLEEIDFRGREVLDVGCGTGIISLMALERGASAVTCGDISGYMLRSSRLKAASSPRAGALGFCQLDAEALPFGDASFDIALTGMTLGLLPDQRRAVGELARVVRPGGIVSVGAHGPEHYWEACDASFRAIRKRYVLGYRLEFWPRREEDVRSLLEAAGLEDVSTRRLTWRNDFPTGAAAYDFFAAISSGWWYARIPPEARAEESRRAREYFQRNGVTRITDDIIFAWGRVPASTGCRLAG